MSRSQRVQTVDRGRNLYTNAMVYFTDDVSFRCAS